MQETIRIGNTRLFHGNCLDILPALAKVNHIITDPPYENELHEAIGRVQRTDGVEMIETLGFDGIDGIRHQAAQAMVGACAGWLIVFCLAEGVRAWRDEIQGAGARYDTSLAWVKPDSMPRMNGEGPARGFECAVTAWCGIGHRRWNGGGKRGIYTHCVNVGRQGEHPTEKPLPLMRELVRDFTQPGQAVLDPFMGSGTTGVACVELGRRFIGIEQDAAWFDLACRRIADAGRQADMLLPPAEAAPVAAGEPEAGS